MTHLSDFSYLQRCALEVYMGVFLFYRVWSNDRMRCLHPKRIFAGELRSIITVLYILMLVMQTSWDVVSTWIKYTEKFIVIPGTDKIISKPFDYWSKEHQDVAQAMDYVECVNLSMQTGVFFLLQCFWNYLSNTVAKKSFMSSWEFKFYIFWALGSVAVFPILQWYYRNDESLRETAPQLAYSIEVLITSLLGIRSDRRFRRILNISRNLKHGGAAIVEKLAYFKDMNIYLTTVLFFYALSLGTLCVDGLTASKTINSNKFASDLLIANCNTASVLMWIVGISIFHPRRSNADIEASVDSRSMTTTTQGRFHQPTSTNDIENNHTNSMRFNENKNAGNLRFGTNNSTVMANDSSTLYEPTSRELINGSNGSFLRPMSPVEVDHPTIGNEQRSFTPTNHFTPTTANRNVSIDDPYSNHAINFTMMEPINNKKFNTVQQQSSVAGRDSYEASYRSASPKQQHRQDYPMQTMSGAAISHHDDFKFDPLQDDQAFDYMQTPTKAKTNNTSNYF
ncbi:uncharacterized protein ATC70_010855 [Mucor velutinosus]|uniref:Uncharacterized protein n=1 Tax=Mucor velutinosus TaxID=708070 RepID=A0AAN7DEC8_9FUNG|nr:hypothetical protein ATC70_010855 [Mucor velutinosus]